MEKHPRSRPALTDMIAIVHPIPETRDPQIIIVGGGNSISSFFDGRRSSSLVSNQPASNSSSTGADSASSQNSSSPPSIAQRNRTIGRRGRQNLESSSSKSPHSHQSYAMFPPKGLCCSRPKITRRAERHIEAEPQRKPRGTYEAIADRMGDMADQDDRKSGPPTTHPPTQ